MVFLETLISITQLGKPLRRVLLSRKGTAWHRYGVKVVEEGNTTRIKRDGETGAKVIDITGSDQVFVREHGEHVGTIRITHPRNS